MKKPSQLEGRAALYDPYLGTLGGGEKHILSILKVLEEEGYEINIFWNKNLQQEIEDRFSLQFKGKLKFLTDNFKTSSFPRTIRTLQKLKNFDYFFYVTDGSYFFSSARKNFVFSMVPDKKLYINSFINKLKTANYSFLTNSKFTQNWLNQWGVKSELIYPFINSEYLDQDVKKQKKENIILSVGRFYSHLHSKNQSMLINWFNKLQRMHSSVKKFKLKIAGGLMEEDKIYFNDLAKLTKNIPNIELQPNLSHLDLAKLYRKAKIYIHTAGFGVDEQRNPEKVEHLGITPLEAMANGCLTFCFNAGGPKELITNAETGFLYSSETDLNAKLIRIINNETQQLRIKSQAKKFVENNFSYEIFKKKVKEVIL